jgi:hypothetical protein
MEAHKLDAGYFSTPRKRISRTLKDGSNLSFSVPLDYTEEQIEAFIKDFESYDSKVTSGEIVEDFM